MKLPEAYVAERDAQAFELKKAGMTYRQIGRALDISESTAYAAVHRVLERIGKKLVEDNASVVLTELERLDTLQQNLWPLTATHRVEDKDGDTVILPPNMDAVDRVLKVMDRRAKLLGLDSVNINLGGGKGGPSLTPAKDTGETTPEQAAKELLRVMVDSGVIDGDDMSLIRQHMGEDIIDAEVVEQVELAPVDEDEEPLA